MKPATRLAPLLLAPLLLTTVCTPALAAAGAPPPDLQGTWTNTTLTRLERPPAYGDRLVMTPEEVAKIEGAEAKTAALARQPTPAGATVKTLAADCTGGRGDACNYNAGWTDSGDRVMRVNGEPRTSFITSPADGRVPFKPEILARIRSQPRGGTAQPSADYKEPPGISDNPESRALGERCLIAFGYSGGPVMLPSLYNNTYRIVQTKDEVAIEVEMVHDVRTVRLGAKHRADGQRPWLGDSIGWYEGPTLVVETTGWNPHQTFYGQPTDHLKVTERFTRKAKDRLLYQFTVEDPTAYTQPWGGEYEMRPSGPIYEYACQEGNYALPAILAGARAKERAHPEGKAGS